MPADLDFGSRGRGGLVQKRYQAQVDLALAQRLERLALEILGYRGPQRIDRVGEQQHFYAAGARGLELRIGFELLGALADEIIDLRLIGAEIRDILLERAKLAAFGGGKAGECQQQHPAAHSPRKCPL